MNRLSYGFAAAVAVVVVAAAVVLWNGGDDGGDGTRTKPSGRIKPTAPTGRQTPHGESLLASELIAAGWTEQAARDYETLNLKIWSKEKRDEWANAATVIVPRLCGLAAHPAALQLAADHPHLANLLAASDDPNRLAQLLGSLPTDRFRDAEELLNVYTHAPDQALLLTALERHADLTFGLKRKEQTAPEQLFMFPHESQAETDYAEWLNAVLVECSQGATLSDDQRSLLGFLYRSGRSIRERMTADPAFASRFRDRLWPSFRRLAEPDLHGSYAAMPGLWEVLARDRGESWTQKYYQLPALLLESKHAYPEEFKPLIEAALDADDLDLLIVLEACRGEADFHELLRTKLEPATVRGILGKLMTMIEPPATEKTNAEEDLRQAAASNKRRKELARIRGWLKDELTLKKEYCDWKPPLLVTYLPGYGVLNLIDKVAAGRDVDPLDVLDAGFDLLTINALLAPAKTAAGKQATTLLGKSAGGAAKGRVNDAVRKQTVQRLSSNSRSAVARGSLLTTATTAAGASRSTTGVLKFVTTATGVGLGSVDRLIKWEVQFIVHHGGRRLVTLSYGGSDVAASLLQILARKVHENVSFADLTEDQAEKAYRLNTHAWWAAQLLKR